MNFHENIQSNLLFEACKIFSARGNTELCIQILWSHIFTIIVLSGAALVQLKLTSCKKCRTMMLILYLAAALIPPATYKKTRLEGH